MTRGREPTPVRRAALASRRGTGQATDPLVGTDAVGHAMMGWIQNLFAPKKTTANAMGDRGENLAARYLRNRGYKIISRNFRVEAGEIDIVARDGKTIVFVEVKTRAYDDPAPEDQVDQTKQHQLTKAGKVYLSRYGYPQPPARFDVVAIVWPQGREPIIRHTPHAFEATF